MHKVSGKFCSDFQFSSCNMSRSVEKVMSLGTLLCEVKPAPLATIILRKGKQLFFLLMLFSIDPVEHVKMFCWLEYLT